LVWVQLSSDLTLREFWQALFEYWDALGARQSAQPIDSRLLSTESLDQSRALLGF
jgi:hypothetical protein